MKASVPSTGSARLPKASGHRNRWDGGRGSSKRRRQQAGDCHGGGLPLLEVSEAAPSVASDENGHVRNGPFVLEWRIPQRSLVPRAWEEALLSLLVKYGRKERGMMRDHPLHRTKQIAVCTRNLKALSLSLRRGSHETVFLHVAPHAQYFWLETATYR